MYSYILAEGSEHHTSRLFHAVGVSFQVKTALHKPVFWLKWSIVVSLLQNLTYEDVHPYFSFMKQHCVRNNPGGQSFRLKNSKNWPEHQMFVMMQSDLDKDWKTVVALLVQHVKDFLTCPIFETMYMNSLQVENEGLHFCVAKDQEIFFKAFNAADTIQKEDVSLNDFLIDEDIREEMKYIYGVDRDVDDLDEGDKFFFFNNGDASQFGTSDVIDGESSVL